MSFDFPKCATPGCENKRKSAGLCRNCYRRKYEATSNGAIPGGKARKLTPEQCAAIRKRSAAFATQQQIAAEFGVHIITVRDVLKRRGAYAVVKS